MVAVAVPGLVLTLTRGPILGTLVAALGLLFLAGRSRILAMGVVVTAAVALIQLWPQIEQAELYEERIANQVNVRGRQDIQDLSLAAAAQKPLFGWGYGSFDNAKAELAAGYDFRVESYEGVTSHNTFLTILVEFGGFGFAVLVIPWLVIMIRGVATVRRRIEDAWFVAGCVAALFVWSVGASTTDQKYFSFLSLLPWLFLGAIRRAQDGRGATSASSS